MLPWLLIFDLESLPEKETISFDPIIYKNVQLDSGGALATYFDRHFAFEYYIRHGTRSFLLSIRALLLLF